MRTEGTDMTDKEQKATAENFAKYWKIKATKRAKVNRFDSCYFEIFTKSSTYTRDV